MFDFSNPVTVVFAIIFAVVIIIEFVLLSHISDLIKPKEIENQENGNPDIDYSLENNPGQADEKRVDLKSAYYAFVEIITIFPLIGMLGTVVSLLSFSGDLQAGNLDSVKQNFFSALGTTCAGLICAIGFKIVHAFISSKVEERQTELDRIIHNIDGSKKAEVSE